jgi:hypothetical protein
MVGKMMVRVAGKCFNTQGLKFTARFAELDNACYHGVNVNHLVIAFFAFDPS